MVLLGARSSTSHAPTVRSQEYRREERMIMKNEKALGVFMAKIAEAQNLLAELGFGSRRTRTINKPAHN